MYIVLIHNSQRKHRGGILVKLDSSPFVWRISFNSHTVVSALVQLSVGALEEDTQDACEEC